ncbi:glycosyltransferase family 39 protein [candidate division WOR-3 bacterium]|nr:glycosyltransferase family 39 protein [candidate division WOR-3 bacterium]
MIRSAGRLALTALAALLFAVFVSSGRWHAFSLNTEGQLMLQVPGTETSLGIPFIVVWLAPIAAIILVLASKRTGRALLLRIGQSRAHALLAAVAVLGFLFTIFPLQASDRGMMAQLALGSTAVVLLLAAGSSTLERALSLLRPAWRFVMRGLNPAFFLLLASGAVLVLTNLISWFAFQHIPHIQDSVGQVFQGRIFASGRVTLPARFDEFFSGYLHIFNDGSRMFSQHPFGHSLLLALGTLIHAEWLINPLLGSAEIVVLYFLGRELYDERTGRIAALLGLASPFLLFMSSEYMNHASGLLFLSLFLLFFFRTIRPLRGSRSRSSLADPLLSGLSLAMALNIRPLSALALSLPVAGYSVWLLVKARWKALPAFATLLVPVLLGLGAYGLYNYLTTGSPLLSGYEAYGRLEYASPGWGLGFGARGFEYLGIFTPLRGLLQTSSNLNNLNLSLFFRSPVPGLFLVLLLLLTFTRNPADWVLLAAFVSLPILYSFYWFQDLCFGPRFLYEGLAPILLLSARGFVEFPRFAGRAAGTETETRNVLALTVGLTMAATAAIGFPEALKSYGNRYWGLDDQLHAKVVSRNISNAIVFVGNSPSDSADYYGAQFLHNTLNFEGPVIYVRHQGIADYLIMRQFPHRTYYYGNPDTLFPLTSVDLLPRQPLIQDLEQTARFVAQKGTSGYRSVLLPYREVGTYVDAGATPCRTLRAVGYDMLTGRFRPDDLLPALAVFMPTDPCKYVPLFEPMRGRRGYTLDGCRFTPLFSAGNGSFVVYDVR